MNFFKFEKSPLLHCLWKHRQAFFYGFTFISLIVEISYIVSNKHSVFNLLDFIITKLKDLQTLLNNKPAISLMLAVVIPIIFTLILKLIIQYLLLPGDKPKLLNALFSRCDEITCLGYTKMSADISTLTKWLKGSETGCDITPDDCLKLGRELIEITKAKTLYATCLQKPQELYDNLKGYTEIIEEEINKKGGNKELFRIIICDPSIFKIDSLSQEEKEKVKWFVKLHRNRLKLYYINNRNFMDIVKSCNGISYNKLDILLFDKRVVSALKNDENTFEVISHDNCYTLFLLDSPDDLVAYGTFLTRLKNASKDVFTYITENSLDACYNIESSENSCEGYWNKILRFFRRKSK